MNKKEEGLLWRPLLRSDILQMYWMCYDAKFLRVVVVLLSTLISRRSFFNRVTNSQQFQQASYLGNWLRIHTGCTLGKFHCTLLDKKKLRTARKCGFIRQSSFQQEAYNKTLRLLTSQNAYKFMFATKKTLHLWHDNVVLTYVWFYFDNN